MRSNAVVTTAAPAWPLAIALTGCFALFVPGCSQSGAEDLQSFDSLSTAAAQAVDTASSAETATITTDPQSVTPQSDEPGPVATATPDPPAAGQSEQAASEPQTVVQPGTASDDAENSPAGTGSAATKASGSNETTPQSSTGNGNPPADETPAGDKPKGDEKSANPIRLLIPHHDPFKVEGPEKAVRVTYDDIDLLKILNMEPVTADAVQHMPDWLKALDKKRVRIRGFMFPTFQDTGLHRFVLARDNGICCFVRTPKPYDVMTVKMRDGETTNYINGRPFDVVGVFHIAATVDEDGELYCLYKIDDAIVIDK